MHYDQMEIDAIAIHIFQGHRKSVENTPPQYVELCWNQGPNKHPEMKVLGELDRMISEPDDNKNLEISNKIL
ncbi:29388_t:CDS:2 [Gigaspora margarita]|uniref:29388_t:CDS:1 n=1 Tax=Gigaspora margarita TaxID=4874 RepID=A0ABM8W722_GIGMA|nr:29388_t:CDS:2 [Gigaspora margarita]